MSKARIIGGICTRNVPWETDRVWRTDMLKSVLADKRLRQAYPRCGPTVLVPAADLRRVLVGRRDHYARKMWGPFNIDPKRGTIDRQKVEMHIEA
jgi:hypothetical protein